MKISLIICTYMRPKPLIRLLDSVNLQSCYPDEILIIDGSTNNDSKAALEENLYNNLTYYAVSPEHRGLTKQRNYGTARIASNTEIVAFLDDDTILDKDYFKELEKTFKQTPDAIGVGGVATNENRWRKKDPNIKYSKSQYYIFGDYVIPESSRNRLRSKCGLQSPDLPGIMPSFSNGRTYMYPLTGEIHAVDLIVGMSMSFRATLFNHISFSEYFNGYGLYEDADFSLRALEFGQNYIATSVQLEHHHDPEGRPNMYKYGRMVLRNGWYVWRIKYPKTSTKSTFKWHATALLLTFVRLTNILTGPERKKALTESLGRLSGWCSLFFNKPKLQR